MTRQQLITFPHPKTGCLLIAEPFMQDDNFKRTVIFLAEHIDTASAGGEGSIGFVLNRPLTLPLAAVMHQDPGFHAPLYLGGPCEENTLHFLHTAGKEIENSIEVRKGLWWGGDFDQIKKKIKSGILEPAQFRFFVGYSGWSPGQLTVEMKEHSWVVADSLPEIVFHHGKEDLWKSVMERLGGKFSLMANFPEDPSLN